MPINLEVAVKALPADIKKLCKDFSSNNTMMNEERFSYMAAVIINLQIDENDFLLEIGTFHGNTAIFLAKLLNILGKHNMVISIDSFGREGIKTCIGDYNSYMENIRKNELLDQCYVISAYSQQAAGALSNNIPFILIDGNHFYESVKADLELYLPKLKMDGIAFIDDNIAAIYPGVTQAINECIIGNEKYKLLKNEYFVMVQSNKVEK